LAKKKSNPWNSELVFYLVDSKNEEPSISQGVKRLGGEKLITKLKV
jgi:hypothetical protein